MMSILVFFVVYIIIATVSLDAAVLGRIEQPDNFLPTPIVKEIEPIGKYVTHTQLERTAKRNTIIQTNNTLLTVRHVSRLWKQKYPTSQDVDSGSATASTENSFESQRKAFIEILDKNQKSRKKPKQFHGPTKIKLKYDYINRKYSIIELSSEEE